MPANVLTTAPFVLSYMLLFTSFCRSSQWGVTGLILAAANGHKECAMLLIRHGADIDLADSKGLTAKDWARRGGHSGILKGLADARHTAT